MQTSSADNNEQQANNQADTDADANGEGIVAAEAAAEDADRDGSGGGGSGDEGGDGGSQDVAAEEGRDNNINNDDEDKEYWPAETMDWFKTIMKEVDASVRFEGRGHTAKFQGKVPAKYAQLIKPSDDPQAFFPNQLLEMKHFCYPHTRLWFPEALHPRYYKNARPPCKWHGNCECVIIENWSKGI